MDVIKFVTGGFTLAALVVVAIAGIVRAALARDSGVLETIHGSPEEVASRERLAEQVLERFHVDTVGMSSSDKKELALAQLTERRKRLTVVLMFALVLGVIAGGVTVYALAAQPSSAKGGSIVQTTGDHGVNVVGSGNSISR